MSRFFQIHRVSGMKPSVLLLTLLAFLPDARARRDPHGGLYLGEVRRMVFLPTGGTEWTTSTEFYLLSGDGRVQRGFGLPEVPDGELGRFDFVAARERDPANAGAYRVRGQQIELMFPDERVGARLGSDGFELRRTTYKRALLK